MPRLHRRQDGGFYLVTTFPGHGYATYQITPDGITFLERFALLSEGAYLSRNLLDHMRDRKFLHTAGTGLTGLLPLAPWIDTGRFADLDQALREENCERGDLHVCFSGGFLHWLRALDGNLSLADLGTISWPDFHDLAGPHLDRLQSELHRRLIDAFGVAVLWRLARVVGRVAPFAEAEGPCPPEWRTHYCLLAYLFDRLRSKNAVEPRASEPRQMSPRGLRGTCPEPFVWWDVDGQRVVAVFPGCPLEPGSEVTWTVSGTEAPLLHPWLDLESQRIPECFTKPLDPACDFRISVRLTRQGRAPVEEARVWRLPPDRRPFVLFTPEGRLADADRDEGTLPPGEGYLVLVPVEGTANRDEGTLPPGVRVLDEVTYPPIGWDAWRGFRVALSADAEVEPYILAADFTEATWRLEETPAHPVVLDSVLPVWLDGWPRVHVDPPEAFEGAVIRVQARPGVWCSLRVGEDITVRSDEHGTHIDLSAAMGDPVGNFVLSVRLPLVPLAVLPPLRFIRLKGIELSYLPDPNLPEHATALRLRGPGQVLHGADTMVARDRDSQLSRSDTPAASPGAAIFLPEQHVELHARLPVTRVCYQPGTNSGRSGWQVPPVRLRLADLGVDDRLAVELHLEPELQDGQLLCRLVGGVEVRAGRRRRGMAYEIPLVRWRDAFGGRGRGLVQLRLPGRWLDLAELEGDPVPSPPPPPELPHELVELVEAALDGDYKNLRDRCHTCLASAQAGADVKQEQLRVAAARGLLFLRHNDEAEEALYPLRERTDLYEVPLLAATARLRRGLTQEALEAEREAVRRQGTEGPLRWRLLSEYEYRYALFPGLAGATWETCARLVDQAPWMLPRHILDARPTDALDWVDALLLRGLAQVMLFHPVTVPADVPHGGPFRWLDALRLTGCWLRTPCVGRPPVGEVPELESSGPAVLRPEEVLLVRVALAQMQRDERAGTLLAELRACCPVLPHFAGYDLLTARHLQLEQRWDEACALYDRLLEGARTDEHSVPRAVLIREYPSTRV
jgi:hypothetical protein